MMFSIFSHKLQVQDNLQVHFGKLGIEALPHTWIAKKLRSKEGDEKVTLIKLAGLEVQMREIHSIEVWQQTRKKGNISTKQDELRYTIRLKPGVTMRRIPILSNVVIKKINDKKTFQWDGFTWGKLPLLVERLKVDENLNQRLQQFFDTDVLTELRIRALSDDKVDIISDYNPQKLPPRELLACIEDISSHVVSYVSEGNKSRDSREEITRVKLFGND
jgi:hypothetical protein